MSMKMHKSGFTLAEGATHVNMPPINAKVGFTLAEILITLGIIGIVAAMTIPTLISNTNSAKFKSQYKKTLSTLNQAAKMAESKYDMNFASLSAQCPGKLYSEGAPMQYPETTQSMCTLLQSTLTGAEWRAQVYAWIRPSKDGRYTISRSFTPAVNPWQFAFMLADGSMIAFHNGIYVAKCTVEPGGDITQLGSWCHGFIDVNGATLPNKEVACSDGTAKISSSVGSCIVRNNATDMGDIFPVVFHDSTVEPLTDAARYVLQQAK